MPLLRQRPGGPVLRVGAGRAPLRTAPPAPGTGTTGGATGGTGTTPADTPPDNALVMPDGAYLALPDGSYLVMPAA